MDEKTTEKIAQFLNNTYKAFYFNHYFYTSKDGKKISAFSWDKSELFDKISKHVLPDKDIVRDRLINQREYDNEFPTLFNFLENIGSKNNWYIQLFEPEFIKNNRIRREKRQHIRDMDEM